MLYINFYKILPTHLSYYLIFLQVLGPRFMENRKPYNLRNILVVYNFLQVLFSMWLFYEVRLALKSTKIQILYVHLFCSLE